MSLQGLIAGTGMGELIGSAFANIGYDMGSFYDGAGADM